MNDDETGLMLWGAVNFPGRDEYFVVMAYCLLLRVDSAGPWPVLLRYDEQLTIDDGVRYRFIAETDTWEEADSIRAEFCRKIEARAL